jgi:hypothetical protein
MPGSKHIYSLRKFLKKRFEHFDLGNMAAVAKPRNSGGELRTDARQDTGCLFLVDLRPAYAHLYRFIAA